MSRRFIALIIALLLLCPLVPAALADNDLAVSLSQAEIVLPPGPLPSPRSLHATVRDEAVHLKWTSVRGAQRYQVWRRLNSGKRVLLGIAKSNHWEDATPPKGSECSYQVLATYSFLGAQIEGERSAAAEVHYYPLYGHIICVDAGHGSRHTLKSVPLAPGSSKKVIGGTTGTASPYNRYSEAKLNLKVARRLQKALEEQGATVVMTRKHAHCSLNNVQRCEIATKAGAELTIRVHTNSAFNSWVNGIEVLVPDTTYCSRKLVKLSRKAAKRVCKGMVEHTKAKDRGLISRHDLPGLNWATNPSILVEMGYMSNQKEDARLQKTSYQKKLVAGIVEGTVDYFLNCV